MKGLQLFAVLLLVAVALVQVQAQDAKASICMDQFEYCSTDQICCRNLLCRRSPFTEENRCVNMRDSESGICAEFGDLCSLNMHCCLGNKCVFGHCQ